MCERNFFAQPSSYCNKAVFSFSNVFALRGSSSNIFNMFKRRASEIDSDGYPIRSVICSINVANVSTGTSAALEDSFQTFPSPFQSRGNGPITCKTFS